MQFFIQHNSENAMQKMQCRKSDKSPRQAQPRLFFYTLNLFCKSTDPETLRTKGSWEIELAPADNEPTTSQLGGDKALIDGLF